MVQKRILALVALLILFLAALPAAAGSWDRGQGSTLSAADLDDIPLETAWMAEQGDQTNSIAWGDWDGDGDLDLVVGNYARPTQLYENEARTLTLAWSSAEADNTRGVAWGDWDNDGDLDLAVGNEAQPNRVYENAGGTLTLAWSSPQVDNTQSVAWGDWDGDGDLDLAVGNYGQPNRVYENDGGTLTLAWSSAEADDTTSVAWGDWDDDGDLDLAVGNEGQPNRVYTNWGGTLALAWSSAEQDDTTSVAWGDWDGDGDLDLAVGNYLQPSRVYRNDGGNLSLAWTANQAGTTTSVAWGDWDSDGDLDLALGNREAPVIIYCNVPGGFIRTWSSPENNQASSLAFGDWDNDGDLDLAVGNSFFFPTLIYNNPYGPLAPVGLNLAPGSSITSMAWGDWDNDGDLDLAIGNNGEPNQVYENEDGTLALAWSSDETDQTTSVAWGDWDNDGDLDLAVGNLGQPNRVYENDGGTLTPAWYSDEADGTHSVAWGDWDSDGDLDLAVGNAGGPNRVYENTGGDLVLAWTAAEDGWTTSVAWGDQDGDGDLDLAVGNDNEPVRLYRNEGGTLTLAWSSSLDHQATGVAWGDWDGDGDLDLAVGTTDAEPNRVYENQAGVMALAWSSAESDDTRAVAWGDWNGDGDLDLAAGNWMSPDRVYENQGAALDTTAAWSSGRLDESCCAIWGEIDQDGDLDLVLGNHDNSNVLYRNNHASNPAMPNTSPHPVVDRPGNSAAAYLYASAEVLTAAQVPIDFRLVDAGGDPVRRVTARYSTDGGGQWHTATITGTTTDLAASPEGSPHRLVWNALADGARGDNVTFMIISVMDNPLHSSGPIQRPYMAATTTPFRLQPLAVSMWPPYQLGIGLGGQVLTSTLTLANRTGRAGTFALSYESMRGWPVDGPAMVGPIQDLGTVSFVVSTTVPTGAPAQTLDVVTVTAGALFNPTTFHGQAYLLTFKGAPVVDLHVGKVAPATVEAGAVMTYTLVAYNAGPSPASGVVLADTLPPEVAFSWASEGGIYSPTVETVYWPDNIILSGHLMTTTVAVTAGCLPSGTVVVNDHYGVGATQHITPVFGVAVSTTVLYDAPVAAFALAGGEVTVGEPFSVTNDSQNATAFSWDFGDGITSTLAEPQHTYTAAGSYTLTLTALGRCGFDLAGARVTATLFLQAGFESNSPVCLGQSIVLTNTTSGDAPLSYLWAFGDGITSTLEHPTHTYAAGGIYNVLLRAGNPFGHDFAAAPVQVIDPPTAGFTYTVVDLTVTLTNTSQNANGYRWSFGDGFTSTLESPTHTYTAGGSYSVTLTVEGDCGIDLVALPLTVQGGTAAYQVFLPQIDKGYPPAPETELAYDDGTLDSTASWETGRGYATCFTPPGASARLLRARYYLQDPQPIEVHVWSADTHADLLAPFQADLAAEGWNEVDLSGYNLAVTGGFCVGFLHLQDYRPTLGADTSAPDNQSYEVDGEYWQVQAYDAMIRVVVEE